MPRYLVFILIAALLLTGLFFGDLEIGKTKSGTSIIDADTFVDDAGNLIEVKGPYGRIISLFAEHTENLYFIGAGDRIIGVDTAATFPPCIVGLPRYSLGKTYDVEQIIAARPDLVLVAPEINRKYPGPVTKLETAGLKVVSLRPDDFTEFDIYIEKLAMLTGRQEAVKAILDGFHRQLEEITKTAAKAAEKRTIFFESSEQGYWTAAVGSLPFLAIEYAGGDNIAGNPRPQKPGDAKAPFGLRNILNKADELDVYVTLKGVENGGSPIVSIRQKPEFNRIKAIREGRLYELNHLFIHSYTFRYLTGVGEIARFLYPEVFDDLSGLRNDRLLDRRTFAEIVVKYFHLPLYVNSSASHYEFERFNHTYGSFKDVDWRDKDFDYIETAVMRSYLTGYEDEKGESCFEPQGPVTRSDVAKFLYIFYDIAEQKEHAEINDIDGDENRTIIRKVVDGGLMEADNGCFYPDATYTNREFIKFLESLKNERHD